MRNEELRMKRAVIIGATSGIGLEVARLLLRQGWRIGVAGRREEALQALRSTAPERVETARIDVTCDDAPERLRTLIDRLGGMDLFFLSSGIGYQNQTLDPDIELRTARTNVEGFTRMTTAAFAYYRQLQAEGRLPSEGGHMAVISSIAGTKGLGAAPAYSATKRFQNTYIDALEQLARMQRLRIRFTDIRPGFVATDLLRGGSYPLLMRPERVAQHIVKALKRRKRVVIIDWRYRIVVFLWRLIPRWLWKRMPVGRK